VSGIPAGSTCTVTERDPGPGYDTPTYSPSNTVTIGADSTVTVTVTNTLLGLHITIVKAATPTTGAPGDTVTYTYRVTNDGKVDLINVLVTDDKLGTIGTIDSLAVGETKTLTKTTTLPATAGLLTNVGTAVGHDRFGRSTSDTDDATVTVVLGVTILPKTGSSGLGTTGLVGLGFVLAGVVMATRKERGRVRPSFGTSAAGVAVVEAANRRSWRKRRRSGVSTRAWFRWRRSSQGPPNRAGP
jgi:LPXTG-motif cell wall-anchored protein